jgi:hypothetical protein
MFFTCSPGKDSEQSSFPGGKVRWSKNKEQEADDEKEAGDESIRAGRTETATHGATINHGVIEINLLIVRAKEMDIAYPYPPQARSFRNLFAAKRMATGGGGKVGEIELRMEG